MFKRYYRYYWANNEQTFHSYAADTIFIVFKIIGCGMLLNLPINSIRRDIVKVTKS